MTLPQERKLKQIWIDARLYRSLTARAKRNKRTIRKELEMILETVLPES